MEKYNEIQLTKSKMGLILEKLQIIHPPLVKYDKGTDECGGREAQPLDGG